VSLGHVVPEQGPRIKEKGERGKVTGIKSQEKARNYGIVKWWKDRCNGERFNEKGTAGTLE
jgi:hypothetical protein